MRGLLLTSGTPRPKNKTTIPKAGINCRFSTALPVML
jgi:hypothetical protein